MAASGGQTRRHGRRRADAAARRCISLLLAALAGVVAVGCNDLPDRWPSRSLRVLTGFPTGSNADTLARLLGAGIAASFDTSVVIENRPESAGAIAGYIVARGDDDAHAFLLAGTGAVTLAPLLYPELPYSPAAELCPVMLLGASPHVLVVAADSTIESVEDLIGRARANPGRMSYASPGNGSSASIAGAVFAHEAGIELLHVPYRGGLGALADLLGHRVSMMLTTVQAARSAIDAGQVRVLAIGAEKRLSALPHAPTFAEHGLRNLDFVSWYALFARCPIPTEVELRLVAEIERALADPRVVAVRERDGLAVRPVAGDELGRLLREERARWSRIADLLGEVRSHAAAD